MPSLDVPIVGVTVCPEAPLQAEPGTALPKPEHVRRCPVCLRRWRMLQAQLQGATPMSHARALTVLPTLVARFADGQHHAEEAEHRAFYAHLAECDACEQDFATAVAARRDAMPVSVPAPRWKAAPLPERIAAGVRTHVLEWVSASNRFAQYVRSGLEGSLTSFALSPAYLRGLAAPAAEPVLAEEALGPVSISLVEEPDGDEVSIAIERVEEDADELVVVRIYRGSEDDPTATGPAGPPRLHAEIHLVPGESGAVARLPRSTFASGRIEVDVLR